jgi:UDP-3-O-[3-hydroxymyristoyl] glucosamine N-acyltransferase
MIEFQVGDILRTVKYLEFIGNDEAVVGRLISIDRNNKNPNALFWCSDANIDSLDELTTGTVICSKLVFKKSLSSRCNYVVVENPRLCFTEVINKFFSYPEMTGLSETAKVSKTVKLGHQVSIGEHVVIGENCVIGSNVSIGHNSVINSNTVIGSSVKIGSNCTIGGCGFGYEVGEDGKKIRINHIGGVFLGDLVELGNNVCIDRGVIGDTILGDGVLVDNLAHISHNVVIGENSMIFALTVICGSTIIGKNSKVAPGASVINKITIGDKAQIGLGAVVVRNIPAGIIVAGNPAKKLK